MFKVYFLVINYNNYSQLTKRKLKYIPPCVITEK